MLIHFENVATFTVYTVIMSAICVIFFAPFTPTIDTHCTVVYMYMYIVYMYMYITTVCNGSTG